MAEALLTMELNENTASNTVPGAMTRQTNKALSHHSHLSSTSSVLAVKRAQAAAARTRVEYTKRESEIKKKQAELSADLEIMQQEREAAAAEAEVRILQETTSNDGHSLSVPVNDPAQRTMHYVNEHSSCSFQSSKPANYQYFGGDLTPYQDLDEYTISDVNAQFVPDSGRTPRANLDFSVLNPDAHSFSPIIPPPKQFETPSRQLPDTGYNVSVAAELTRFLLKKELLLSRLTTYNDLPETYAIWKAGFSSIMQELQVTHVEELDLLVKWLGPESCKHALSIRASYVHNPQLGLERIWERLDERYGAPEMVEAALKEKLARFPKLGNKDCKKLYDLSDIVTEIEAAKADTKYQALLAYFDSSSGVRPIVSKLPYSIQEKWATHAVQYKRQYKVPFPPFVFFSDFLRKISQAKNDPSFAIDTVTDTTQVKESMPAKRTISSTKYISAKKTEIVDKSTPKDRDIDPSKRCPVHKTNHALNDCKAFKLKPFQERKALLKELGICFRCCASNNHLAQQCQETIKCLICESTKHPSALHISTEAFQQKSRLPDTASAAHGGEGWTQDSDTQPTTVSSKCTQICGEHFTGKSCAKTLLVNVYQQGKPEQAIQVYAILDEQSNRSLAKTELFDRLSLQGEKFPYTLSSCAGQLSTAGRRTNGLVVESLNGRVSLHLPTVVECNEIPDAREEIPTPEVAMYHRHLKSIAHYISPMNDNARILLLIGRDLPDAHHVKSQKTGPRNSPFAQELPLGWVIVGESCLGKAHKPDFISVFKTQILSNGRPSVLRPCPNALTVKTSPTQCHEHRLGIFKDSDQLGLHVFHKDKDDDKPGLSVDDRDFINIMNKEFVKDPAGNWIAPLPFRTPRPRLPNNRPQAWKRAITLDQSLRKNHVKKEHMTHFMAEILENGHAERAPPVGADEECWYLPVFGIYHPRKPNKIRAVFDSSAVYEGLSLNNVLLSGPDLTNSLLGILLRFRKEPFAIMADIQQMFYCFSVREDHRNFLRFFWYENNDPTKQLVEYRMCRHVFGNSPSPAVATYGLRKTAELGATEFGADTKDFVDKNFYVDDGLTSLPTETETVSLVKRTQQSLLTNGHLRLHKIASNISQVMSAFPTDDVASDLKELDFSQDELPTQRSLGVIWDLSSDTFQFKICPESKPYTRRGILSTINSIFDPLGFVAPVVVGGKLLLRELMGNNQDWDHPLPVEYQEDWDLWRTSLQDLENLHIPRTYTNTAFTELTSTELWLFSDASEKAISAVAYLKSTDTDGNRSLAFLLGKCKVAPAHGHTIPRLELCAAVLAVEILELIKDNLNLTPDNVILHTDSKVVLGYIYNKTRRFHVYVCNRVQRILHSTSSSQWAYVSSGNNPADIGTRSCHAKDLTTSEWLTGPTCLLKQQDILDEAYPMVDPDSDAEVRPRIVTKVTNISDKSLGAHRFEKFPNWTNLLRTIAHLKHVAISYRTKAECKGWHICRESDSVSLHREAKILVIKEVQQTFRGELQCIRSGSSLPNDSPLIKLNPYIDQDGLLRVGGRLNKAEIPSNERNPIIIPARHHIGILLVRYFHESVKHQGRHITEGAVRAGGYWIIGGKRLISSIIHSCVKCRKLRGKVEHQQMSDLPPDRLKPLPPFTHVGVDTFGPWSVVARRTRGGIAHSKRWAIIFTCLSTRAIHLEVIEDMSASSFINALRRFIALRGKVAEFRSDRGTNFVGCVDSLKIDAVNVEDSPVRDFLYKSGVVWTFNPPHSSHMGGVWERLIGITRRILDSMLSEVNNKNLTHEVLTTFMAEVCAIVNARPIVPVSTDPECPHILSPATLLTLKTDHVTEPPDGTWDLKDLYKAQWRCVQTLADMFWKRWRKEFLQTLQVRRKWTDQRRNIRKGDVIILKDKTVHRNEWPVGLVLNPIVGGDSNVRKAVVRIMKDGHPIEYTRPITEMVVLVPNSHE